MGSSPATLKLKPRLIRPDSLGVRPSTRALAAWLEARGLALERAPSGDGAAWLVGGRQFETLVEIRKYIASAPETR